MAQGIQPESRPAGEDRPAGRAVVSHAAGRLARALPTAVASPSDLRALAAWGQCVGISRGALRVWCATAHVSARSTLDFVRLLRAVCLSQQRGWDLFGLLDVTDRRTLVRLL